MPNLMSRDAGSAGSVTVAVPELSPAEEEAAEGPASLEPTFTENNPFITTLGRAGVLITGTGSWDEPAAVPGLAPAATSRSQGPGLRSAIGLSLSRRLSRLSDLV